MPDPVIIGDATLYCGDARDILPTLDPVNLIVSDLPYKLESGGKTGSMGGKFARDRYNNDGKFIDCEITFGEMMPLMADCLEQGHAYFMVNNRHVGKVEVAALLSGFRFHNWLVWDKGTATQNRWYMKNCEFTLLVFRGEGRQINDCGARQLIMCPNLIDAPHPTQKPVELMEHYIQNSSQSGETVLDPFMGAGTTGVAALRLGRAFVGIEKDRGFFDISCERIAKATDQRKLF